MLKLKLGGYTIEKQKEGFEKNRIYNLKVKKEKIKKEYIEIKGILKQSELMK